MEGEIGNFMAIKVEQVQDSVDAVVGRVKDVSVSIYKILLNYSLFMRRHLNTPERNSIVMEQLMV